MIFLVVSICLLIPKYNMFEILNNSWPEFGCYVTINLYEIKSYIIIFLRPQFFGFSIISILSCNPISLLSKMVLWLLNPPRMKIGSQLRPGLKHTAILNWLFLGTSYADCDLSGNIWSHHIWPSWYYYSSSQSIW